MVQPTLQSPWQKMNQLHTWHLSVAQICSQIAQLRYFFTVLLEIFKEDELSRLTDAVVLFRFKVYAKVGSGFGEAHPFSGWMAFFCENGDYIPVFELVQDSNLLFRSKHGAQNVASLDGSVSLGKSSVNKK